MSSIPVVLNPSITPELEGPAAAGLAAVEPSDAGPGAADAQQSAAGQATEDQLDYLENQLHPAAGVAVWALYSTLALASTAVAIAAWRLVRR